MTEPTSTDPARAGFLTLDQAAAYSGKSRWTLRDHMLKGKIPGYQFPGDKRSYLALEDVERYCTPVRKADNR